MIFSYVFFYIFSYNVHYQVKTQYILIKYYNITIIIGTYIERLRKNKRIESLRRKMLLVKIGQLLITHNIMP